MPTLHDCLVLIVSTRSSAGDPESAYVLRSRLKRSLMAASQFAASYAGVTGPLMPEDIERLEVEDPVSADIVSTCVSLLGKSRTLCQPSEALDTRWRTGWELVQDDLDRLERTLRSVRAV